MSIAGRLFRLLPARSELLYRLSKRYVDRFNGENNSEMGSNGELEYMRRILPSAHVVFDVGANQGNWTELALQINRALQIHCFEPTEQVFQKLASRQFPASIVRNRTALGSSDGEAELFLSSVDSQMNSMYARRGVEGIGFASDHRERITLTTGDRYCRDKGIDGIDFLKIDVEGHELAVLQGFGRMLGERRVRVIQFEYGGCNIDSGVLLRDLWEFLERRAFLLYKLFPEGPRRVERYAQALENFQYQNWAAVLGT